MDLKNLLKTIKLQENRISTILGIFILLVAAIFVIRYIHNLSNVTKITQENTTQSQNEIHKVTRGETLWGISEKYYQKGSDWKKIADANKITDASKLEVGQELTIPDVQNTTAATEGSPAPAPTQTPTPQITTEAASTTSEIKENTYIVVKGDSLWKIAVRAYGDGTKWHQIAEANKLKNPRVIHSGNVFTIPR